MKRPSSPSSFITGEFQFYIESCDNDFFPSIIIHNQKYDLYFSINGDGAAEPVPSESDSCAEAEDACERAEYGPSWPATFSSSTSDSDQSSIPKEVMSWYFIFCVYYSDSSQLWVSVSSCIQRWGG